MDFHIYLVREKWEIFTSSFTYRSQIFHAVLDATEDEAIPERVEFVATVVHDTCKEIVDVQWPQVIAIVPHCISYSVISHNSTN